VQAIYDRLQDHFFGPQVDQATKRKDLDFDHSTPGRKLLTGVWLNVVGRGPWECKGRWLWVWVVMSWVKQKRIEGKKMNK